MKFQNAAQATPEEESVPCRNDGRDRIGGIVKAVDVIKYKGNRNNEHRQDKRCISHS